MYGRHGYFNSVFKRYSNTNSLTTSNYVMDKRLVWVDCEMTGLDVDKCHLLEIACLITDDQLNIVAEGPNIVIHQPDEILNSMNNWCLKHHSESGLMEQVRNSRISVKQAEMELLSFVRQHTPPGMCPLAGNSIHVDKKFLEKYMPQFSSHFHYRIVDVSTIKELASRWYPDHSDLAPVKKMVHRAMDDILESIAELRFYRSTFFKML
ncbi:hypothetical protein HELRODRAFT_173544 [Helobdella robusta]|uniref:Exonuclease domain-containing protein n=1 Tax=Helobdella robusta TaxID=6412 RepID=T1F6Y7_HELRO|nr:hypothetical protein HELRODRAFT_173544 [Helobdella robusta]ESO03265.1 hypothetical protein HELRODRAFT_173544 [Helobdella robusta]